MMRTVGEELSLEEAEAVVRSADKDGDGLLDLEEFVGLVGLEGEEEKKERELREAFGMYEMEGEGCITPRSLKRMLSRLGSSRELEDCQAMICRFDLNGDGVISFDEFKVMMMSS
ncbi:putative calcium-binding protein CML31 [Cocos nucifera]|uniref:Putative calcium-binding protein CML31 n=1 Tax=Cocos nucifera TaxID=13894 RepID=A0A8K0J2P3_COCNU|nr:putative calcium-binding protein CML31 [Cocos nucifera]